MSQHFGMGGGVAGDDLRQRYPQLYLKHGVAMRKALNVEGTLDELPSAAKQESRTRTRPAPPPSRTVARPALFPIASDRRVTLELA